MARHQTLLVTFEEPIHEDDLKAWIQAIQLLDGVAGVEPGEVSNHAIHAARMQLRSDAYEAWAEVFGI